MYRRVHARKHPMLRKYATVVRRRRRLAIVACLSLRVQRRRLHGQLRSGVQAVQRNRTPELRQQRLVGGRHSLPLCLRRRVVHGILHAGKQAVQRN